MERRAFIKTSCLACGGILTASALFSSCTSLPLVQATFNQDKLMVAKSEFVAGNLIIVRNNKIDADILLRKKEDQFIALRMMCTHEEQPLTATTDQLHCASHGSSFNLNGDVVREPATKPLKKYKITETDNEITIHLNQYL